MGLFLLHLRKRPSPEQRRASQRPSPGTAVLGPQVDAAGREKLHADRGRGGGGFTPQTHKTAQSCPATSPTERIVSYQMADILTGSRELMWFEKCENPGPYGSPGVPLNGCFFLRCCQTGVSLCVQYIYYNCTLVAN